MMSHDEVFSIGDLLSLRNGGRLTYRPTVMFVYHPCDDAMLSVLELEGRGWQPQQRQRRLGADIVTGMDELGVLLAGHARNAYWYGSQLVDRGGASARAVTPMPRACQVAAGALAADRVGDPQSASAASSSPTTSISRSACRPPRPTSAAWSASSPPGRRCRAAASCSTRHLDVDQPWQLRNVRSRQWRS